MCRDSGNISALTPSDHFDILNFLLGSYTSGAEDWMSRQMETICSWVDQSQITPQYLPVSLLQLQNTHSGKVGSGKSTHELKPRKIKNADILQCCSYPHMGSSVSSIQDTSLFLSSIFYFHVPWPTQAAVPVGKK